MEALILISSRAVSGRHMVARQARRPQHLPPRGPSSVPAPSPRLLSTTCRRHGESSAETRRNATATNLEDTSVEMTGDPEAYISLSPDPYFNLTLEDFLFRTRPADSPVCLLYRNDACVVLGRNQNPWKELNVAEMRRLGLRMVRRRSGGGTVYHDSGNTNYSFHVSRASFVRATHSELMVRALNAPPIGLASPIPSSTLDRASANQLLGTPRGSYVNKRNDICVRVRSAGELGCDTTDDASSGSERKVSGSAYKLINARAYHHGTMLLGAKLCSLGSALRNERGEALVTKGVASVPAPVINLSEAFPHRAHALEHETLCGAVVDEFFRTYPPSSSEARRSVHLVREGDDMVSGKRFSEGLEELRSWEWTYGQTPEFSHDVRGRLDRAVGLGGVEARIHAKNGLVLGVELGEVGGVDDEAVELAKEMLRGLEGRRYDELALAPRTALNEALDEEEQREAGLRALGVGKGETMESKKARVALALLSWFREAL